MDYKNEYTVTGHLSKCFGLIREQAGAKIYAHTAGEAMTAAEDSCHGFKAESAVEIPKIQMFNPGYDDSGSVPDVSDQPRRWGPEVVVCITAIGVLMSLALMARHGMLGDPLANPVIAMIAGVK